MYEDLSQKQVEILEFLKNEVAERGYPPAIREIGAAVCLKSTSTVHSHLTKLEEKGYIRRDPTKNRAIDIVDANASDYPVHAVVNVPIVGDVAAGSPILAVENIEDTYPLPVSMTDQGDLFMLRIRGDSMIEAGILQNDLVIVRKQNTATNGEIVVAMIDEAATVKRFFLRDGAVELRPENSSMEPIVTSDCQILGKVIGLQRKIH